MCGSFANAGKKLNVKNVKPGGIRCVKILCIERKVKVWGQSPQPPEANGERRGLYLALDILILFPDQIHGILHWVKIFIT